MNREDEIFFVAESMRHAKTLPLTQAAAFLNGMRASIGEDHPLSEHLAERCRSLYENEEQLELIARNGALRPEKKKGARR